MSPGQLPLHRQIPRIRQILSSNPTLLNVLNRAAILNLPNWYLAGGALSQTVWNSVSKLAPETGIREKLAVF